MEHGEVKAIHMADEHSQAAHADGHFAHAYDRRDPNFEVVGLFSAFAFVLFLAVVGGVMLYYYIYRDAAVYERVLAPESRELRSLREREDQVLHRYGYADRAKGIVRIPIDRAMQLLVEESASNRLRYPTAPYALKTEQQAGAPLPGQGPVAGVNANAQGPAPNEAKPGGQQQRSQPGNTPTASEGVSHTKQQ